MFGLDVDTLRDIRLLFKQFLSIEKVVLYGSRVKGNYRKGSDIDITLIGKDLSLDNTVDPLMRKIDDLNFPYTFDISIFNQLDNLDLIDHILRVGKPLYEKEDNTNWPIVELKEVCILVRGPFGGNLKKSIFKSEGYAIYEQQHAIYEQFRKVRYFIDKKKFNEMNRFELKPGDLIMSCSGTMGKVAIAPKSLQKGIINQALLKLTPKPNLSAKFLKLFMESQNFQNELAKQSKGAAIKNIASVKILKEIEISLPSLAIQKQIVATLNRAFEGIDKAIKNKETNLKSCQELFDSYLCNIFSNYDDDKQKTWPMVQLREVCNFLNGKPHEKIVDKSGKFILVNSKFISSEGLKYKRVTKQLFPLIKGDIVFVMSDVPNGKALAKCFLVDKDNTYSVDSSRKCNSLHSCLKGVRGIL